MSAFSVSIGNMINIIVIAIGIGISGMIILQVKSGAQLRREVTRYFQLFFGIVILYIGSHLVRQLLEGQKGAGVHYALYGVTLLEFLASGVMAFLFSELTLFLAKPGKNRAWYSKLFIGTLALHMVLMFASQFTGLCYYFDAENIYHRAPAYLLSNLAHVVMLGGDVCLLIKYRSNFNDQVRPAFWTYIIAPFAAILVQAFFRDIQFIILATVAAAVFMSMVIMRDQMQKFETV